MEKVFWKIVTNKKQSAYELWKQKSKSNKLICSAFVQRRKKKCSVSFLQERIAILNTHTDKKEKVIAIVADNLLFFFPTHKTAETCFFFLNFSFNWNFYLTICVV